MFSFNLQYKNSASWSDYDYDLIISYVIDGSTQINHFNKRIKKVQ